EHWSDAFLHRLRGEILLKRDPANTAPAEDAFLTAIAITQQQKARSFELRAALSLAKLYQSTSRSVDAHALLVSVLKGFSPTPGISRDRGSANASQRGRRWGQFLPDWGSFRPRRMKRRIASWRLVPSRRHQASRSSRSGSWRRLPTSVPLPVVFGRPAG